MKDINLNFQSSEHILLTGAGFTKNFGAPLAIEMWATIFNHKKIQAQPRIKELMMDDFDYESIYTSIIEGSYTEDEKKTIKDVVKFAYDNIDSILRKYALALPHSVKLTNITEFITLFNENRIKSCIGPNNRKGYYQPKTGNKSFIFTLNQDLFFERLYSNSLLSIPGIKNNSEWFDSFFGKQLRNPDYCQLPNEGALNRIKPDMLQNGNFFLIKLHGSCNWISSDDSMVIGKGKKEQIQKEPLLRWYSEIFKKALSHYQRRLLIIGYGFGDEHINHILAEAVGNYELKIYIISPDSPSEFKTKLVNEKKHGKDIWQGISGYFQNGLREIFPESQTETQARRNLFDFFFEQDKEPEYKIFEHWYEAPFF
jgi:hypothetical protein